MLKGICHINVLNIECTVLHAIGNIHINFPYSTCIRSFFGSSILTLFVFKCFFGLVSVIFLQYIANVTHRTFRSFKKIEITRI